jgi:hypothetical protein
MPGDQKVIQSLLSGFRGRFDRAAMRSATPDELQPPSSLPPTALRAASWWPRASPCAAPQVLVKGRAGSRLRLQVESDFAALPLLVLLVRASPKSATENSHETREIR